MCSARTKDCVEFAKDWSLAPDPTVQLDIDCFKKMVE